MRFDSMVFSVIFADNLRNIKQNSIQMNSISISNETIQKQLFTCDYKSFDANNVNFIGCGFKDAHCQQVGLNNAEFHKCGIVNCAWEGNEAQATFRQCLIEGSIMKHDQPSQYRFERSAFGGGNRIITNGYGEILMARCLCKETQFSVQSFTADAVNGITGTFTSDFYNVSLPPKPNGCVFERCVWIGNGLPANMRLS